MRDDTSVSSEEGPSSGADPQGLQALSRAALTLPATQQAGDEVKMRSKSMERNHSANPEVCLRIWLLRVCESWEVLTFHFLLDVYKD